MSGILALGIQDFKRLLTNALFWVITATLVLIILVINFALPENAAEESGQVYVNNADIAAEGAVFVDSEEALRQAVRESGAVGILGSGDGVTVLNPGLSEKTVRAIMTVLSTTADTDVGVERLSEGGTAIPFNRRMTPVFICFEALVIGLILGGALMLSEKESGAVRALRVSPIGADRYLVSKAALFSVIAVIYALLMAVFCVGFGFSVWRFVLLSFFGAAIFSLIGLAFTTLFRDMSGWFFSMALMLSVNMLPVVAYLEPSFPPLWLRIIPSYPIIFAYEAILFGGSGAPYVALVVGLWCAGAYLIARIMVGKIYLKRGR